MPSVFIERGSPLYESMFKARGWEIAKYPIHADLIQFTGGSDVSPHLYGEKPHATTSCDPSRDYRESNLFTVGRRDGIPCAGICRGGQFLHVMCGGKLHQNVMGHATPLGHKASCLATGEELVVTSTHHQAMIYEGRGELLMASQGQEQDASQGGEGVEAIVYLKEKVLCFQPHPELCNKTDECQEYYFDALKKYLLVG